MEGERAGRRDLARRAGVETPTGLRSESSRSWSVDGVASRLRRPGGAGDEDEAVRLSCFLACMSHGSVRGMLSGYDLRSVVLQVSKSIAALLLERAVFDAAKHSSTVMQDMS